jgi:hypothetical protein
MKRASRQREAGSSFTVAFHIEYALQGTALARVKLAVFIPFLSLFNAGQY